MSEAVKPYTNSNDSKKVQVEEMFDNISHKYDFLNRLLSMKIDVMWRNKLIKKVQTKHPNKILDVATGTGDLAIEHAKNTKAEIIGLDLSQKMLNVGVEKIKKLNLENRITMIKGDAENLPFEDDTFDVVSVSFGVRNFENVEKGLREMRRVLKQGGTLYILEFSKVEGFFAPLFTFYFKYILPIIGKVISKDSRAYTYLPDSVNSFPYGEKFRNIILSQGFSTVNYKKLTFGVATLYEATK
ncbi:MAG: bifunctional demethylmenaquinone methyltransferase/2-methoxy-6-polyprenyl-1,4-benzoquinol methylase UbiE [Flavobacteriales bacterium]|nr:bifunctional demethylmenaquinone methyltransferase/2-methoxy-6-polyprenyl-1,4-benzoquinol methylase UbiE [Flavobacteriales bacterium]